MNVHFGHPKICASHQEGNEIKSSYLMAYLCHIFLICKVGKIMLLIASIMTGWDHMKRSSYITIWYQSSCSNFQRIWLTYRPDVGPKKSTGYTIVKFISLSLATWCKELTHLKRHWCWERLKPGGEAEDRGWDGWMASPTQWRWVWADSGSWWWTGRSGVLWSMRSWRVGHDRLNWAELGTPE